MRTLSSSSEQQTLMGAYAHHSLLRLLVSLVVLCLSPFTPRERLFSRSNERTYVLLRFLPRHRCFPLCGSATATLISRSSQLSSGLTVRHQALQSQGHVCAGTPVDAPEHFLSVSLCLILAQVSLPWETHNLHSVAGGRPQVAHHLDRLVRSRHAQCSGSQLQPARYLVQGLLRRLPRRHWWDLQDCLVATTTSALHRVTYHCTVQSVALRLAHQQP